MYGLCMYIKPVAGSNVFIINRDHSFPQQIFFKFRGPVFQIPWLTAANLPNIVINLGWPLNPTKYAVFVAVNSIWQIQSVYLINQQYFR